jgi:hypothetical protein
MPARSTSSPSSSTRHTRTWRPYDGSNPHEKHMHVSVSLDPAGFDSTVPWGITEEADPMADYAAQLDRIEKKVDASQKRDVALRKMVKAVSEQVDAVSEAVGQPTDDIKRRITKAKAEVLEAIAELDQP